MRGIGLAREGDRRGGSHGHGDSQIDESEMDIPRLILLGATLGALHVRYAN